MLYFCRGLLEATVASPGSEARKISQLIYQVSLLNISPEHPYVVQQFVEGPEVSTYTVARDGQVMVNLNIISMHARVCSSLF